MRGHSDCSATRRALLLTTDHHRPRGHRGIRAGYRQRHCPSRRHRRLLYRGDPLHGEAVSATSLLITAALILPLAAFVTLEIIRTERRRQQWRRERPAWWSRNVFGPGLRQSVRPIDERAQAEILQMRDPRLVNANRRAPRNGLGPAPSGAQR